MKRHQISRFSCILFLLGSCVALLAQEGSEQEQFQAWMKHMAPGPQHEMLAKSVGKWKTKTKVWMEPGSEPMVSEGACKNTMIMGGRYLQSNHTGMMMNMPMEGLNLQGYDNTKKVFNSIWIDNLGTGVAISEGSYDENTKMMVMDGVATDPMTGEDSKYKITMKYIDNNNQLMEMFVAMEGQEMKLMEIAYTRQSGE